MVAFDEGSACIIYALWTHIIIIIIIIIVKGGRQCKVESEWWIQIPQPHNTYL